MYLQRTQRSVLWHRNSSQHKTVKGSLDNIWREMWRSTCTLSEHAVRLHLMRSWLWASLPMFAIFCFADAVQPSAWTNPSSPPENWVYASLLDFSLSLVLQHLFLKLDCACIAGDLLGAASTELGRLHDHLCCHSRGPLQAHGPGRHSAGLTLP